MVWRVTLLLLALMMPLLASARALAGPLLPSDQIAFSRVQRQRGDIYLLDLRTGIAHALTRTPAVHETAPVWSSDGTHLAFLASAANDEQPYVIGITPMATPQPLTDAAAFYPLQFVAAISGSTVTLADLYRPIETVGRERLELRGYNSDVAFQPSYTTDGLAVLYVGVDQRFSPGILRILDRVTGHIRTLTPRGYTFQFPVWSPDGRWIAVQYERSRGQSDLVLLQADCLPGCTDAMQTAAADLGGHSQPDWSPDASRIVFSCPLTRALCVYDLESASSTAVTHPPMGAVDAEPAWRPHG